MSPFFDLFRRSRHMRYPPGYYNQPLREGIPPDIGVNVKVLGGFQFIEKMIFYRVKVKNLSENPLGKVEADVKFNGDPLGEFIKDHMEIPMLDPGQEADLDFPFKPFYKLGSGRVTVDAGYFDFSIKAREEMPLKGGELKVFYKKTDPYPLDEDRFRVKSAQLKKWEVETDLLNIPPKELFDELTSRAEGMGLYALEPYEAPLLYRGIQRFSGQNRDLKPVLSQVQVIGKGEESKMLLYFWGESLHEAYGSASRLLNKVKWRDEISGRIIQGVDKVN